ncbi:hypothetical protein CDAR_566981 [Caerostris darwini]|uniref:Uncharacterized protein n=1 Tax=Caerostris darwini TaxID=1538125 RepID=A0AAV4MDE3_9ARAC|nr:hypothetical protein CDAR_566981 [Caerostris darwini]
MVYLVNGRNEWCTCSKVTVYFSELVIHKPHFTIHPNEQNRTLTKKSAAELQHRTHRKKESPVRNNLVHRTIHPADLNPVSTSPEQEDDIQRDREVPPPSTLALFFPPTPALVIFIVHLYAKLSLAERGQPLIQLAISSSISGAALCRAQPGIRGSFVVLNGVPRGE